MKELSFPKIGETLWSERLENGLQVFVVSRPEFSKAYAFFAVRYGGMDLRFEEAGAWRDTPAGVAHFLEHKMFDTEDGNALQDLARNGAQPNAFTSSDLTAYFFDSTEQFEDNLRTLLSFVSVPWFTEESVQKEQGIIGQEIRMGEDDPDVAVYYGLMESLYAHMPVRVNVAGTVESISGITAETLYACHRAFYQPANMCLCVAGDVSPEMVLRAAREILPRKRGSGEIPRDYGPPESAAAWSARWERRMEVSAPLFLAGWKCDPPPAGQAGIRQSLIGEMAFQMLLGDSSPLYARLYSEGLINKSFGGAWEHLPGCACFVAGGESRDPDAVAAAIAAEADRIAKEGLDGARFERTKRALYGARLRNLNSFEATCVEIARAYFAGGMYYDFPQLYHEIEPVDVERYLAESFRPERAALSVILPPA